MSYSTEPGHIGWIDLTVEQAEAVRDFYAGVAGWEPVPVEMPERTDFSMMAGADPIAGVCHAVGELSDLPPQWLIYINVADLDSAMAEALRRGGSVIVGPKAVEPDMRYVVLRDPAEAPFALIEQAGSQEAAQQ